VEAFASDQVGLH